MWRKSKKKWLFRFESEPEVWLHSFCSTQYLIFRIQHFNLNGMSSLIRCTWYALNKCCQQAWQSMNLVDQLYCSIPMVNIICYRTVHANNTAVSHQKLPGHFFLKKSVVLIIGVVMDHGPIHNPTQPLIIL